MKHLYTFITIFAALFVISMFSTGVISPSVSASSTSISLDGGIEPNYVGSLGFLGIGVPWLAEYKDVSVVAVTLEYYEYDSASETYNYIADDTSIRKTYLSFVGEDTYAGEPLLEGTDYVEKKYSCAIGSIRCDKREFVLLNTEKLADKGRLQIYYEGLQLLKTGTIKATIVLLDEEGDPARVAEGFIDIPIVQSRPTRELPSPTGPVVSEPVTSPSVSVPGPTETPKIEYQLKELKKQLNQMQQKQESMDKDLQKQASVLDGIINFLKGIFAGINPFK